MDTLKTYKVTTRQGEVIVKQLEKGWQITSPGGTHHTCLGRNKFFSAMRLWNTLSLFYGQGVALKVIDHIFKY